MQNTSTFYLRTYVLFCSELVVLLFCFTGKVYDPKIVEDLEHIKEDLVATIQGEFVLVLVLLGFFIL